MISLPLTTPRLRIRMMRSSDVTALAGYRNDPDVATHQDWQLPFTTEMAAALIESQSMLDGPADGNWVQMAIERDGDLIGDVAVGIHDNGLQGTIGYTIAVGEQGNGYATEAVTAVVEALFAEAGLHRIVATIDPRNAASRRVLQKLGFRNEGMSPSSVMVRGEWADDDRFAMLAREHAARLDLKGVTHFDDQGGEET